MTRRIVAIAVVLGFVAAACGGGKSSSSGKPVELKLVTHDSFAATKAVLADFERASHTTVKLVQLGDAGAALNQVILSKNKPLGDAFFGIDNTFLTRGLDAGVFVPYQSPALKNVDKTYDLDSQHRVTPIDHGDVCVNYDKKFFAGGHTAPPASFEDLTAPALKGKFVVENPATSSPGLAFLLGTIAHFGENGWQDYWRKLRANGVQVAAGWEEAYNQSFSGGSGKGAKPLVVSYASSPPAEVVFADPKPADSPVGVMTSTCFQQVEFAGVLRGAAHQREAQKLVDFMLSKRFQEDMPLQMYVFPVIQGAALPDVFVKYAAVAANPLRVPAADIGRNRDRWISQWTAIVLQ